MHPQPTHSEKKVKPMACSRALQVKASGSNLKRNSRPPMAPGSIRPRTMSTSIITKRSGIRNLEMRSMPFVTSSATMRPLSSRKSHWKPSAWTGSETKLPKCLPSSAWSVMRPEPVAASAK